MFGQTEQKIALVVSNKFLRDVQINHEEQKISELESSAF